MPYTTWGWMSHADVREVLADMDMHDLTVEPADSPDWFMAVAFDAVCPVCGTGVWTHESITFPAAGGVESAFACVDHEGEAHQLGPDPNADFYCI